MEEKKWYKIYNEKDNLFTVWSSNEGWDLPYLTSDVKYARTVKVFAVHCMATNNHKMPKK